MRKFQMCLVCACVTLPLMAQSEATRVQGYGYFGVAASNGTTFGKLLNPGLGADVTLYKGLAVGADVGYVGYYNNFRDDGFGLFSPNVTYHFVNSSNLVPFVTAGYSMSFRNGTANLGNYGAGFTYWFARRVGVRAEGRDTRNDSGFHVTGARFGIAFR
jgi:hypothetical protein